MTVIGKVWNLLFFLKAKRAKTHWKFGALWVEVWKQSPLPSITSNIDYIRTMPGNIKYTCTNGRHWKRSEPPASYVSLVSRRLQLTLYFPTMYVYCAYTANTCNQINVKVKFKMATALDILV